MSVIGSRIADATGLLAIAWAIPFLFIAIGLPLVLLITGLLWVERAVRAAF